VLATRQLIPGLTAIASTIRTSCQTWDQVTGDMQMVAPCHSYLVILLLCWRRKAPRFKQQAPSFKQFRMILKNILKKQQAASFKRQAIDSWSWI